MVYTRLAVRCTIAKKVRRTVPCATRRREYIMSVAKGLMFGIGLSVAYTILYVGYLMFYRGPRVSAPGPGVTAISLSGLFNGWYWLGVVGMVLVGFVLAFAWTAKIPRG